MFVHVRTSVTATQFALLLVWYLLLLDGYHSPHAFLAQRTAKVPWEVRLKILWNCHRLERSKATLREPHKQGRSGASAVWIRIQTDLRVCWAVL